MSTLAVAKGITGCEEFQEAISAFVDDELSNLDSDRMVTHLNGCEPCRHFAGTLNARHSSGFGAPCAGAFRRRHRPVLARGSSDQPTVRVPPVGVRKWRLAIED
jgi:predicted anti-sigma-YlaC factor YlaD